MAEKMPSREDAEVLRNAIKLLADDFERMGFSRGEIGAALAGVGLGMAQVHLGHERAMNIVNSVRDCLLSDAPPHC